MTQNDDVVIDQKEVVDADEVKTSRAVTAREAVTVSRDTVIVNLMSLKGHRISDTFPVVGQGDVTISGSLRRVKPRAEDVQASIEAKNRAIVEAQANAALAESKGDIPKAKEYLALANSLMEGGTPVVRDSGKTDFRINLRKGGIVGGQYVFFKNPPKTPISLWFDGVEYRLRLTVARKLLGNEQAIPTDRQLTRKARNDERQLLAQQALAGARSIGALEQRIQSQETSPKSQQMFPAVRLEPKPKSK